MGLVSLRSALALMLAMFLGTTGAVLLFHERLSEIVDLVADRTQIVALQPSTHARHPN